MKDLFNKEIIRLNTSTYKWDDQKSKECLPFWIADSDYQTAPCVLDALFDTSKIGAYGYNIIPDEFYNVIVNWYKKRYNTVVSKDWIVPTTGVILEIRMLIEMLTEIGDGVILQTPVYHTFHQVIKNLNRTIIENKLKRVDDTYYMDLEDLEMKFIAGHKVMILCSPHNPVGRIWKEDEIKKVLELAKRYNVFVIVDEIHSDLNITNNKFTSALDFANYYNNIAICNAPSKAFNLAGLHTAYIIIPHLTVKRLFEEFKQQEFQNSPSVFCYNAMIAAYTKGDEWIDAQNEHIKNNYNYLKSYLNKELPELVVTKLEGTYLVWLDLSFTNLTTKELLERASNAGITCTGGVNFCKDYDSFLRFNIACPMNQLQVGLTRLVKAFK
jgi:cystathionine beta-lyase